MNNQFIFIGRITRNLVLKELGDTKVVDVTLAVQRKFKNDKGEYDTDFILCKAFGKVAEYIAEHRKVGDLICVSGRVQTGSYTNQENKKVYTTDFIINETQFLAASKKEENQEQTESKANDDDPYASFSLEHSDELGNLPFEY